MLLLSAVQVVLWRFWRTANSSRNRLTQQVFVRITCIGSTALKVTKAVEIIQSFPGNSHANSSQIFYYLFRVKLKVPTDDSIALILTTHDFVYVARRARYPRPEAMPGQRWPPFPQTFLKLASRRYHADGRFAHPSYQAGLVDRLHAVLRRRSSRL